MGGYISIPLKSSGVGATSGIDPAGQSHAALIAEIRRVSIDRCHKPVRFEHQQSPSSTKPGTLIKKAIPVQAFTRLNDERPGFEEIEWVGLNLINQDHFADCSVRWNNSSYSEVT